MAWKMGITRFVFERFLPILRRNGTTASRRRVLPIGSAVANATVTQNIDATLDEGGVLRGKITGSDSGAVLPNATATLYDADYDYVTSYSVSTNGIFTFTNLATGEYYLRLTGPSTASAYETEYFNDQPSLERADPIAVRVGEVKTIDAALDRAAQITGTVLAADNGLPLDDVRVRAYRADECNRFQLVQSTTTDIDGRYALRPIEAATYFIEFEPLSYGDSRAYLAEYYDDALSIEESMAIVVSSAETIPNIDAQLTRGNTINGSVTASESGNPLDDVNVSYL